MKVRRKQTDNYLAHYGIQGQKWGRRRYQNADGTLTAAGKKRYNQDGPPPPGDGQSPPSPPSEPTKPTGGPPEGEEKPSPPEKRTISDYEYAKSQYENSKNGSISDYEYSKYGSKGYVASKEQEEPEQPQEPSKDDEKKNTTQSTSTIDSDQLTNIFDTYYTKAIETAKVVSEKVTEYAKSGYEAVKNSSILNTSISSIKSTASKAASSVKKVAKNFAETNLSGIKKLFK